jgi:serine/threonine protein kinase
MVGGKWRLDALIGVGGMAAVYMATHRNGSMAALKILHEEVALNQEVRERFLREAYIANKVKHPGTVKVLDDDKDDNGAPYIVMELLRGESVESKSMKAGGRLSIAETLDILDQTLAVLEAAHKETIVHRDLKPENLFMTDGNIVKVLDFGIARLREENSKRTQTGMVMGTPSFMAPEQAMGRWNDVDARTDLWAMGATTFTLLTGQPVHQAETAGEMLVAAATRPARSLARVLNNAPFALVAMVDRALAYDRDNRFPDAATFRQELAKVRSSLGGESLSKSIINPAQQIMPATVVGQDAEALRAGAPGALGGIPAAADDDDDEDRRVATYDPSNNTDEEIERMQKIFTLLERALTATKQYSPDHPECKRRFDETFREIASALMTCDVALAWNLTPYSFGARDKVVWEPEAPWNRIPYQLFSDGVRTMGMAPGLDEVEFKEWLKLMTLDPTTDLAPEDDLVTMLWDAGFDHVFFQAIDSFAEGNQDQRARYEAERAAVLAGAHLDHKQGLAQAVQTTRAQGGATSAEEKSREVFKLANKNEQVDAEAAARVQNLNLMEESPQEAEASQALQLDPSTQALLAARLELDIGATSERFVVAAADAFVASAKMGRSTAVTAPLRRAVDSLGEGAPGKAIDMILELREAVQVEGKDAETESLRNTMTSEVLSSKTLLDILKGSSKLEGDDKQDFVDGMTKVLASIQSQHFDAALEYLPECPPGQVQQLLLDLITRLGRGNELRIAALFAKADIDLGLALVRLFANMDTAEAREAVSMASQSPHPLVRIEALGQLEGQSGTRLRNELKKLVEDDDPQVRLAALLAMEKHNIVIAGPFLVLRIQEDGFAKLPYEERQQSLQTLCKLRPKRGEEVCMAILAESKLLRPTAFEETRELAAQNLAEVASSDQALHLLESIANSSGWKNGKRVRDAAAAALARLQARAKEAAEAAERRKAEREARKSMVGAKAPTDPGRKRRKSTTGSTTIANPKNPSGAGATVASKTPSSAGGQPAANGESQPPKAPAAARGGT